MKVIILAKQRLLILLLCLLLTACANQMGNNEGAGVVIGGILGGVLGQEVGKGSGRTAATILGAIIGTSIGGNIGRSMDETDQLKVAHSLETVRTGVSTSWQNPDTGNRFHVVPTRTFVRRGSPCREFQIDASIGTESEKIYGTACRQQDGSWKVQN